MIDDKDAANSPLKAVNVKLSLVSFVTGCIFVVTGFAIAMDGALLSGEQFNFGATVFMGGVVLCVLTRMCKALLSEVPKSSLPQEDFKKSTSFHDHGLYNVACYEEAAIHYGERTQGFMSLLFKVRSYMKGAFRK